MSLRSAEIRSVYNLFFSINELYSTTFLSTVDLYSFKYCSISFMIVFLYADTLILYVEIISVSTDRKTESN